VRATGYFHEFGRNVDAVAHVVDGLAPAGADIIFIPAVAGHAFVLLACVAEV